jgi:hypothetical protein
VYDRFGLHHNEVRPLLGLPGVDYYPFTRKLLLRMQLPTSAMQGSVYAHRLLLCLVPAVYQLTQPNKYNKEYAKIQVSMLFVPYSGRLLFGACTETGIRVQDLLQDGGQLGLLQQEGEWLTPHILCLL